MTKIPDQLDWQQDFIASNLIAIGATAWSGYLVNFHHGVVVCSTNAANIGITGEIFQSYFVPRHRLAPFLNAWLTAPDTVILRHHFMSAHILEAVTSYDPTLEVVLLLESGDRVTFLYLRNLPITPCQCHEYIQVRQSEFHLESSSKGIENQRT
jgi:hypothetical protein